jgi:hypothetical protein
MLAEPIHVALLSKSNTLQILPAAYSCNHISPMSPHSLISPNMAIAPPPSVAVTLAVNPPAFKIGEPVELSVYAVSDASYPITIFTWPTIFNVQLAQQRGNFIGRDQDEGWDLPLHTIDVSPGKPCYTLGGKFDEFFVTLEPGQPFKFNSSFLLAQGPPPYAAPKGLNWSPAAFDAPDGSTYKNLLPGHRYLLDISDMYSDMSWWKIGRKEDVLNLPGQDRNGSVPSGGPIFLSRDWIEEFEVLPLDN